LFEVDALGTRRDLLTPVSIDRAGNEVEGAIVSLDESPRHLLAFAVVQFAGAPAVQYSFCIVLGHVLPSFFSKSTHNFGFIQHVGKHEVQARMKPEAWSWANTDRTPTGKAQTAIAVIG
jgi:hypothetical protein